jgi:hypothetical protein
MPGGLLRPHPASAENAIKTIVTDALYGGAAGLLLGGVLMLVVDKDNRDDTLRWGAVIGTFAGFAYGIYETQHGSGEYSELLRRHHRLGSPRGSDAERAELARWAESLQLTPMPGSPLAASDDLSTAPAAAPLAMRSAYGREPW